MFLLSFTLTFRLLRDSQESLINTPIVEVFGVLKSKDMKRNNKKKTSIKVRHNFYRGSIHFFLLIN